MRGFVAILLFGVAFVVAGCSTSTNFTLPPNTTVRINHKPIAFTSGPAEMRPFFWNSAAGVSYLLTAAADGSVVKKGKLPTRFRIASIFWPPYALIYWPMGFACASYDLTEADDALFCK